MSEAKADQALKLYQKEVTRSEDFLLRLMDEAILLRVAKRFEESNRKFFQAAKIIEMNGYTSLGEQALTLVTNERQTTYQGEDFEKVLVHLYLGLNFLELNQESEAQVEMRKVNEILQSMMNNGRKSYEFNAFARYLGGILFENSGDLNDALVSYRNTLKIDSHLEEDFPQIGSDIIRMGKRLEFTDELEAWKKQFGPAATEAAQNQIEKKWGSLVLIYEAGKSPQKYSSKEYHKGMGGGTLVEVMVPVSYYKDRKSMIQRARLKIRSNLNKPLVQETAVLNSIKSTAITHLKDRMGRQIAKAIATAATKVGLATAIGKATKSSDAGVLAGLALLLMSEADTRSWLLLPENFQLARIFLPAGTYRAEIELLNLRGVVTELISVDKIQIKPQSASFISLRSFE